MLGLEYLCVCVFFTKHLFFACYFSQPLVVLPEQMAAAVKLILSVFFRWRYFFLITLTKMTTTTTLGAVAAGITAALEHLMLI